jgi:hypothetical protein
MEDRIRFHLLQAIFEAEMATDFIETVKKDDAELSKIDISKCTTSE